MIVKLQDLIVEYTTDDKVISKFVKMLSDKIRDYYMKNYKDSTLLGAHDRAMKVTVKPGKKYIKIDIGDRGAFIYDPQDGNLYFIKGYGVIDRRKNFGNLEQIVKRGFDYDGYSIAPKGKRTKYGYGGRIA